MDSKPKWYRNGIMTRLLYGIVGALMILAFSALTALPDIEANMIAIEHNSDSVEKIEERLLNVATRDDLNRMEDNLKGYIRDLLKADGGQ